jgi:hypothetical protein
MIIQCQPYKRDPVYTNEIMAHVNSYTSASGVVSASSEWIVFTIVHRAYDAVDYMDNSMWFVQNIGDSGWIKYVFGETKQIVRYAIKADNTGNYASTAQAWVLEGSNDGAVWDVIDEQSGVSWSSDETKTYDIPESGYSQFRFSVDAIAGTRVGICDIFLYTVEQ